MEIVNNCDYEIECKHLTARCAELEKMNKELESEIERCKGVRDYLKGENSFLRGRIQGLEFAIRCNGVSGAEVVGEAKR